MVSVIRCNDIENYILFTTQIKELFTNSFLKSIFFQLIEIELNPPPLQNLYSNFLFVSMENTVITYVIAFLIMKPGQKSKSVSIANGITEVFGFVPLILFIDL